MTAFPLIAIIIFYLWFLDAVMILAVFLLPYDKLELWLDKAIPRWSRRILGFIGLYTGKRIRLHKPNLSQLPDHFVLISNHQSLIDILVLFAMFPQHPLRFVGKNSLKFGFPGVTRALRLGRHAFVSQHGDPVGSINAVRVFSRRCVQRKKCPVIFPEGSRSRDGNIREFKTGGFRTIADGTNLPIVAVALDGGYMMASIKDMASNGFSNYRSALVKVYDPPKGKQETAVVLADANQRTAAVLDAWRTRPA